MVQGGSLGWDGIGNGPRELDGGMGGGDADVAGEKAVVLWRQKLPRGERGQSLETDKQS